MILGDASLFTREHYDAHRGVAPAHLCELVVHCLELVSQLSHTGLDYRFKGGNSQLILLEDPQRFSIDVDIVSTVEKTTLIELVETLARECELFKRCEVRQHKTKPWLPMVSFNLYFDSVYASEGEACVMLDAVLEPPPYAGVTKRVRCGALYASDEEVEVPAVSGLIADKLLCVGPSTLGIPLGKNKEAQRIKHVFDVATLSRHDHDLEVVRAAVVACMEQENRIQKSAWDLDAVVADTMKFCRAAESYDTPPDVETIRAGTYLDEVVRGYAGFRDFLFKVDYTWQRFQQDCARVVRVAERVGGPADARRPG